MNYARKQLLKRKERQENIQAFFTAIIILLSILFLYGTLIALLSQGGPL